VVQPHVDASRATALRGRAGLRLQIVLALAGLMLLAFVPLFVAVASLVRTTVVGQREQSAHTLARALSLHLTDAYTRDGSHGVKTAMDSLLTPGAIDTLCVTFRSGEPAQCATGSLDADLALEPPREGTDAAYVVRAGYGRAIEARCASDVLAVVTRTRLVDPWADGSPLVRLVALYMTTFGFALLVFAYISLTRLIVRPIEQLAAGADRVASGSRTLALPRAAAREISDLALSVRTMADRLISEEAALQRKVEELTGTADALTRAQAQVIRSERMASVGHLAAGLAHEIGNPIAALLGMEELLLDGAPPDGDSRDLLLRMKKETERIHTVVRDLLEFARPDRTNTPEGSPASQTDVRSVIDDVFSLVRAQESFRTVALRSEVTGTPAVTMPASRLAQVLLNLVLNAGAAAPSGGRVVVSAHAASDGLVRIEVEDNGPGVSPEVRGRLFEPFVTTKDVGEGTGLGLAVCRGLVESAGGAIDYDTKHVGGARFYVVLPSSPS
jgi:signal transduction histidine kinase